MYTTVTALVAMSKNKRGGSGGGGQLGRSLIKEKKKSKRSARGGESWLHSSEVGDGYEWGRLNLKSVTEESRLDEFLSTAQLAGTEFTAEKLNIKVVDPGTYTGLPSAEERDERELTQEENRQFLNIPRRPQWDSGTTAEQLDLLERDSFLEWRRQLARLQENDKLVVTPFEKNLEFWRQLWRVVERSDVVVQIVDARNPLLFRCEDLEKYVKEIDPNKVNMVLVSKADLLTSKQRRTWKRYFEAEGSVKVAFWSALAQSEQERISIPHKSDPDSVPKSLETEENHSIPIEVVSTDLSVFSLTDEPTSQVVDSEEAESTDELMDSKLVEESKSCDKTDEKPHPPDEVMTTADSDVESKQCCCICKVKGELVHCELCCLGYHLSCMTPPMDHAPNSSWKCPKCEAANESANDDDDSAKLLSREELIDLLLSISPTAEGEVTTVGMVGYPNVGKSSTINALFQGKKVPVSATPGRTKHFQTLYVTDELMLCDCPGLVFPNFVSSKAEMICNGILPIDQMRDHVPPVSLVCQRIPRHLLEATYGIRLPQPGEGEDGRRVPYAHELLEAYGYMRGFMTQHGRPDLPRSARYILKDYVNGKLLYCHPPPGVGPTQFNDQFTAAVSGASLVADDQTEDDSAAISVQSAVKSEFDEAYFKQEKVRAISKGVHGTKDFVRRAGGLSEHRSSSHSHVSTIGSNVPESESASFTSSAAPDKSWKKHHNRNKKEKIKRIH